MSMGGHWCGIIDEQLSKKKQRICYIPPASFVSCGPFFFFTDYCCNNKDSLVDIYSYIEII